MASLTDYKFYCINGKPKFIQIMADRNPNSHDFKIMIVDTEWQKHPEYCSTFHPLIEAPQKPVSFDKMIEIAEDLAGPFPFVRIDFYEVNKKPIFGEMTFTPGFDTVTLDFERIVGEQIVLPKVSW